MDDLLQKHSLQEADITAQAERVQTLNSAALKFTTIEGKTSDDYVHRSALVRSGMCFDNNEVILRDEIFGFDRIRNTDWAVMSPLVLEKF